MWTDVEGKSEDVEVKGLNCLVSIHPKGVVSISSENKGTIVALLGIMGELGVDNPNETKTK